MAITAEDKVKLQSALDALVGQPTWGPALGHGSFVTVEFGKQVPPVKPKEVAHGEWHLWLYCCAWHVIRDGEIVAASEDVRDTLPRAIATLDGKKVKSAQLVAGGVDLELTFDDGAMLRSFAIFSSGYEHWMLYMPTGEVLTVGPGLSLTSATGAP